MGVTFVCGVTDSNIFFHIFSTFCHKRHGLRKKVIEHKVCVLIFSTPFVWKISHSKKNSERFDQNVYSFSCKMSVILVRF